jgi:hypothetical protein
MLYSQASVARYMSVDALLDDDGHDEPQQILLRAFLQPEHRPKNWETGLLPELGVLALFIIQERLGGGTLELKEWAAVEERCVAAVIALTPVAS